MATAELNREFIVGEGASPTLPLSRGTIRLDSALVRTRLESRVPGLHFDLGGRQGVWHPDQEKVQAVRYYYRHICSCDRGEMPQWPEWTLAEGLASVPLDEALKHEEMPILDIDPLEETGLLSDASRLYEHQKALVWRSQVDDIKRIGWAELFYRLLKANLPNLTPEWFAVTFRVPMDWYMQIQVSPLSWSFNRAKEKGWA